MILNVCKTLTTTFFPILTYMYVSRIFGTEGYGKINFSNSIIQYFVLLSMLGITNYATSEAAKIRDDNAKLNRFVSEIMMLNMISMMISYILLFIILKQSSRLSVYECFIFVYSFNIVLRVIGMEWLYSAVEDYFYITIRTIIVQMILLACVLLFIRTPDDIIKYAVIQVASAGGSNIFNFIHSRKYISFVRVRLTSVRKHLKPVMILFLMTVFINLFTQIDSTMIGFLKNDSAVGLYAAGDKMSSMVAGVLGAISMVMLPRLAYYYKNGLNKKMADMIMRVVNIVLLLAIPSALGICLLSKPIIMVFSGAEFAPAAVTLKILSLRVLFSPLNAIFVLYIFIPMNRERSSMFVTAMAAITNFIVNLVMIPVFSYNGAAFATVLAEAVELIFVIIIARRILPLKKIFRDVWQYVAACISILGIRVILSGIVQNTVLEIVLVVIGSAAAYFMVLVILKNEYAVYLLIILKEKIKRKDIR